MTNLQNKVLLLLIALPNGETRNIIKELVEELNNYENEISYLKQTNKATVKKLTEQCAELKKQLESSQKEIQELKENRGTAVKQLIAERDTYRAALKDLMGTFVAYSDHNKELAIKCKNILGGNA